MNAPTRQKSACPHDCPSTCALDVEIGADGRVGRLHGREDVSYTAGVICAKVARYAERLYNPDRLTTPLRRTGPKGSGQFQPISWDEAMEEIASRFLAIEAKSGPQAIWPYYYAGTMGLVQRDGINRLRHVKRYSGMQHTICVNLAWPGWIAGTGRLSGADPREMAKADLVVIWGTNPVSTQVNVMTHAIQARKQRGAKIAVVDIYNTPTMQQADMPIIIRPGSDGALACAIMHVLFRDGYADRDYLAKFTDCPAEFEAHLATRTPDWASAITGLCVEEIETFAAATGRTKRTFIRLGYGFTRQRNGAVNMHAVSCIPAVTGAWQVEGGGAFHNNGAIYHWDKSLTEGHDAVDPTVRQLDQSRIGAVLTGEPEALRGGPPVEALFIQNTNPMVVAPDQAKVRAGFAREDLFTVVHEQIMTETAKMADIVLPATMFLEHDDFYQSGGHQAIQLGPKLVEPPGECRPNHRVICELAHRLGARHRGFDMSERQLIDEMLGMSGWGGLAALEKNGFIDAQPDFETAHYLKGFNWPDGKFRFRPDWKNVPFAGGLPDGPRGAIPPMPDHWAVIEEATDDYPFRLATSPARNFLNTSFNETPTSRAKEGNPSLLIHPEDCSALGLKAGELARVESARGAVRLAIRPFKGVQRGVVIAESLFANAAHADGLGINTLTGDDAAAPYGGAAFHDNRVRISSCP